MRMRIRIRIRIRVRVRVRVRVTDLGSSNSRGPTHPDTAVFLSSGDLGGASRVLVLEAELVDGVIRIRGAAGRCRGDTGIRWHGRERGRGRRRRRGRGSGKGGGAGKVPAGEDLQVLDDQGFELG